MIKFALKHHGRTKADEWDDFNDELEAQPTNFITGVTENNELCFS